MKTLKRFGAIILALVMVLGMSSMVFGEPAESDDFDSWNQYNGLVTTENTIGIAKQVVFYNAESTTVREPNITYTYTISSIENPANVNITGAYNQDAIIIPVQAGPIEAVNNVTASVIFIDTATALATSTGVGTDIKYAEFTFNPSEFEAPGIYRYKIVETTYPTKTEVGITETEDYYYDTRYLDVYVKWHDEDHTTLAIYGYVLYEGTEGDSIEYDDNQDLGKKSPGYVNTAATGADPEDVDIYTTQNLEISKITTGSLADKNHPFPLTITFTKADGLVDGIKLDFTVGNDGTLTKTGTDTNEKNYVTMDASLAGTVKDTSNIKITGIPVGSKVTLKETNNTVDSYYVKAGTQAGLEDLLTEAVVASGADSEDTTLQTFEDEALAIHLTNTLEAISPTGVVMRFAPYALILAGGVALLVIALKRKSRKDDDD